MGRLLVVVQPVRHEKPARGQDVVCGMPDRGIDSPGTVAGVLLGQPEETAVLGHVVVVGVGVGRMGVRCVGIGTIVGRMRHPRIGGVAGVRRGAIQVANLQADIRLDYNLFSMDVQEHQDLEAPSSRNCLTYRQQSATSNWLLTTW